MGKKRGETIEARCWGFLDEGLVTSTGELGRWLRSIIGFSIQEAHAHGNFSGVSFK